jgi:hypothetical protein
MLGRSGLWLTKRQNRERAYRYYFQPSRFDISEGWRTIRLHDKQKLPITTEEQAIVACKEITRIHLAWKRGRPGFGPHLIDELRGMARPVVFVRDAGGPGTIAAIMADFMDSDEFDELRPATRNDYRLRLEALVERFGSRHLNSISAKEAKMRIREKVATHPSITHQWLLTPPMRLVRRASLQNVQ